MTDSGLSVNELEEALARARVTIDYLIADVVRLKNELNERNEKIRELRKELQQTKIKYQTKEDGDVFSTTENCQE